MNLGETTSPIRYFSWCKKNAEFGITRTAKPEIGAIVRKLGLWILIVSLSMAVKILLFLSRFFERLSQRLYRGIVPLINTLNKGD